jgi:co-chaperonin GroES (HSP10)
MSSAEMHRIEKAALEDPFLADAIEGIQFARENFGDEKINTDIAELRKGISGSRERTGKVVYATWWRAAAVLAVVVTAVAMVYFFNQTPVKKAVTVAKVEELGQDTVRPAPAPEPPPEVVANRVEKKVKDSVPAIKKEEAFASKEARQKPVVKAKAFRYEQQKKIDDTGRVVSEQMTLAKEQAVSPQADTIQRNAAASALEGRAAGVVVTDKSKNKEAEADLEEVVVVGYGARKKSADKAAQSKRITPEGGWISFDEYINSNKRIDGADSLLTGFEEVTFGIDEAGIPVNFKIVRSLSESHDKETIRLLKEGPTWNVEKGRRRLRLKVKF